MNQPSTGHPVSIDKLVAVLPSDVQRKVAEGEAAYQTYKAAQEYREFKSPKLGRPKGRPVYRKPVLFVGDSQSEIDQQFARHLRILGPKTKGNRRRGNEYLYKQLTDVFEALHLKGITLPRNGSLSTRAVIEGVGQVLVEHGYTQHSLNGLVKNSKERHRLGHNMRSIFERVASEIDDKGALKR